MWRRGWGGAREDIGLRSNDGDAWHPTAPTTVLVSHSPEIPHHTPHHITSFLATSPDTSGTRDERVVPPRTPFGDTCAFGEALWKTRRRVIGPIPFGRHKTPIHNKSIPATPIRHVIPSSTTTRHDTPISSPVRPSKRMDRPRDELIELSRVVCRPKCTWRVSKQVGWRQSWHSIAGDATWGDGRQGGAERARRGCIRGQGHRHQDASDERRMWSLDASCPMRSPYGKTMQYAMRVVLHEASLKQRTRHRLLAVLSRH